MRRRPMGVVDRSQSKSERLTAVRQSGEARRSAAGPRPFGCDYPGCTSPAFSPGKSRPLSSGAAMKPEKTTKRQSPASLSFITREGGDATALVQALAKLLVRIEQKRKGQDERGQAQ